MAVMNVKNGTKAFSSAGADPALMSTNGPKTNSAFDLAKMGDENIGDFLNKISDPNWVDPTKKIRTAGSDKMDKDAFMKLMIAQMRNQDPMNSMKSHELAAQLAQFSSVEQLQNVNQTLTELKSGQKPTETFQALNFIGKSVMGDSAKLVRAKGDQSHDFGFDLPADASDVVVKVRNANGEIVRTVPLKDLKKGGNNYQWNGLDERGQAAPAGEYQFLIEATNSNGGKLAVKTDFEGVITGVNFNADGPVLLVGTQSVKLKDVKKIVDPSLMKNDQNLKSGQNRDLLKQQSAAQNEEKAITSGNADDLPKAKEAEPEGVGNLMSSVEMSREMMDRLQKETRPDSQATAKR
jgi:flagellar basal-body rod modification protein FlgD